MASLWLYFKNFYYCYTYIMCYSNLRYLICKLRFNISLKNFMLCIFFSSLITCDFTPFNITSYQQYKTLLLNCVLNYLIIFFNNYVLFHKLENITDDCIFYHIVSMVVGFFPGLANLRYTRFSKYYAGHSLLYHDILAIRQEKIKLLTIIYKNSMNQTLQNGFKHRVFHWCVILISLVMGTIITNSI